METTESKVSESTDTSVSSGPTEPPADGEINILIESLDVESNDGMELLADSGHDSVASLRLDDYGSSDYGNPLSVAEAAERMPPGGGGISCTFTIIPDEFFADAKILGKHLKKGDFDPESMVLKPRRPSLPVRASNFFSSLTKVGPRYIFHGLVNGWPGVRTYELMALETKASLGRWKSVWKAREEGQKGIEPKLPNSKNLYRAIMMGAPWSREGWSKDSPGFVFWYQAQSKLPKVSYGTRIMDVLDEDPICTHVHMVSHRYAVKREGPRDLLTYHSVVLVEWDHGRYATVMETAYLNGIGGYKGRSNWYHDRDEPVTKLLELLPDEMICPWRTNMAEIRCYDVKATNLDEFMAYVNQYRGNHARFIDPRVSFSHPARLTFRSKKQIARYLLNYITRDANYETMRRNCQTFAADFCAFMAGKREVSPFHPVSRIEYQNRTYLFLYDSHMYNKKEKKDPYARK